MREEFLVSNAVEYFYEVESRERAKKESRASRHKHKKGYPYLSKELR